MSRGYKNRRKRIRDYRIAAGLVPRPMQEALCTPRSARMKDLRRLWRDNAR